jgi:hypothetical protein
MTIILGFTCSFACPLEMAKIRKTKERRKVVASFIYGSKKPKPKVNVAVKESLF